MLARAPEGALKTGQMAAGVAGRVGGRALVWCMGGLGFDPSAMKRGQS